MKSTNTYNYQSKYFVQAMRVFLKLSKKIGKILLIEYPYSVAANQYLGIRVEYKLMPDAELTEDELKYIRNWDDRLEIYLGRDSYADTFEKRQLKENIKDSADSEIKNIINLFNNFCDNVVINPSLDEREKIDNEYEDLDNTRHLIAMRPYIDKMNSMFDEF